MYLADETDKIFNKLKESTELSEYRIIKAYPFSYKATRLKQAVICVSPSGIDAKTASIGGSDYFGEYTIDADVFVPQDMGTPCTYEIIEKIVKVLSDEPPCGVKVSAVSTKDNIECYTAKCTLTFRSMIYYSEGE